MGLQKHHASSNSNEGSVFISKWETPLGDVLRHLNDLFYLQGTCFARLSTIKKLAQEKYPGKYSPESRVLVDIIRDCVVKISAEFGNDPKYSRDAKYLELIVKGVSCRVASETLGLSREHTSRHVRREALRLLVHQFVQTVHNKKNGVNEKIPSLVS